MMQSDTIPADSIPKKRKLYDALNQKGLYTKTYDDFSTQFSNPQSQEKLYGALKEKGLVTIEPGDFRSRYFEDTVVQDLPGNVPVDTDPDPFETIADTTKALMTDSHNKVSAAMTKQRLIGSGDLSGVPDVMPIPDVNQNRTDLRGINTGGIAPQESTRVQLPEFDENLELNNSDQATRDLITTKANKALDVTKDAEFTDYVQKKDSLTARRNELTESLRTIDESASSVPDYGAVAVGGGGFRNRLQSLTPESKAQRDELRKQLSEVNKQISEMESTRIGREAMDSLAEQIKSIETEAQNLRSPWAVKEAREQIQELGKSYETLGISLDSFSSPEMLQRRLSNAAQRFARTGVEMVAGTIEGATLAATELPTIVQPLTTIPRDTYRFLESSLKQKGELPEVHELATYQFAQNLRKKAEAAFPGKPDIQGEFVSDVLPGAMASFGMFIGATALGATVGLPTIVTAGTLAGLSGMSDMYNDARDYGASEEDAKLAARWGTLPGALQVIPVLRVLDRYDKAAGGQLKPALSKYLIEGAKGGFEEMFAEGAGQVGFNVVAKQIYDQERELVDGMAQAGAAGGVAGFLASAIISAAGGRAANRRAKKALQNTDDSGNANPPSDGAPPFNPEAAPEIQIIQDAASQTRAEGTSYTIDGQDTDRVSFQEQLQDPDFVRRANAGEVDFEIKGDPELAVEAQAAIEAIQKSDSKNEPQGDGDSPDDAGITGITVREALESGGIYLFDDYRGSLSLDGQTVILDSGREIVELGNVQDLETKSLSELGVDQESPLDIRLEGDGYDVAVDGKTYVNNYTDPSAAVNYDDNGGVVSVNLETTDGKKRTFRGDRAEMIAYQYELKSFETNATEQEITRIAEETDQLIGASPEVVETTGTTADPDPSQTQTDQSATGTGENTVIQEGTSLPVETTIEAPEGNSGGSATPVGRVGAPIKIDFSPDGKETVSGTFALVEANDLIPSHNADGSRNSAHQISEGQPRDRSSNELRNQPRTIAENLNPARVTDNELAFFGSPIITSDGQVIQGNGRSAAIKIAYSEFPQQAASYKQYLAEQADKFGINPEDVQGMQQPVLVRRTDVAPKEAIRLGNIMNKAEAKMAPIDMAKGYVRNLVPEKRRSIGRIISDSKGETLGEVIDESGFKILQQFEGVDRNGLVTEDGLTNDGKQFIKDVFTGLVFDNNSQSNTVKQYLRLPNLIKTGIEKSYGHMIQFVDTDADITPALQRAIDIVDHIKRSDGAIVDVDTFMKQGDAFDGLNANRYTQIEAALAQRLLDAKSQKDIRKTFQDYENRIYGKEDLFEKTPAAGISPAGREIAATEALGITTQPGSGQTRTESRATNPEGNPQGQVVSTAPSGEQYGATNKLISADRAAQVRAELQQSLGQLNMGLDPKTLKLSTELAMFHLEAGARKFADFSSAMIRDLGDAIKPYLRSIYNRARRDRRIIKSGIDKEMTPWTEIPRSDIELDIETSNPGGRLEGSDPNESSASSNEVIAGQLENGYDPSGSLMPAFFSKALLGFRNTFESASDKLRRRSDGKKRTLQEIQKTAEVADAISKGTEGDVDASTIEAMAPIAELIDVVFDRHQANTGAFNKIMADPIRKATTNDKKDFEKWARAWDQKRNDEAAAVYDKMSKEGQALVDAWRSAAEMTGTRNQEGGVQVFDPKEGGMRPIGKAKNYYPRRLQEWAQNALYAPTRHPKDKARLVQLLITKKLAKDAKDAERFIRANGLAAEKTSNDYFSAMEKARTDGFPEEMYDYSLDTAIDYGLRWSERLAQIETLGQDGTQFDEVFDRIIRKVQDPILKKYLQRVKSRVYNDNPVDPIGRMIATLNMAATGLQLGNFRTALQNLVTGSGLNYVAFGNYALRSQLRALQLKSTDVKETEAIGVLQDDILSVQRDLSESTNSVLSAFTSGTMKLGGYTVTERQIRMQAYLSGKMMVRDLIKHAGRNPNSHKAKKLVAWMQRNNFDYTKLLAENGEGEYTNRVLRYIVNLPQGSYKINMTPVLVDEPLGRLLFKYRKYGTQVERLKWLNHIEPFMQSITGGEKIQIKDPVSGKMVDKRAFDFVSMLRLLALPPIYGLANKWTRWTMFGTLSAMAGPDWEDIEKALDDSENLKAVALSLQIAWESVIMSGILGNIQTPIQIGRDINELKSVANPLDPPALGPIKATWDFLNRWRDQGTLTGRDIDIWANRSFSYYNSIVGNKPAKMLMVGMGMDKPHLEYYRLESAEVDKEIRRYAMEVNLPEKKLRPVEGGYRPTSQTPVNREISEAIILGRPEQAKSMARAYLESLSNDAEISAAWASIRAHVRNRQPIVLGSQYNNENRDNFLEWGHANLHPDKLQRIITLDSTYRSNAVKAGFMEEEKPFEARRRERNAEKRNEELTDRQKELRINRLLGRDVP